jgi:hypothetical protein
MKTRFKSPLPVLALLAVSSAVLPATAAVSTPPANVVSSAGDITAAVAAFRTALGDPLNAPTVPGEQAAGRREINWDGVPADVTNNDAFPRDFFSLRSKRGIVFSTPGAGFRVSDNDFADVNAVYGNQFNAFSPAKTFAPIGSNVTDVFFQVAADPTKPAAVSGFGAVFSDVDVAGSTRMEFFQGNTSLGVFTVPARSDENGLSFLGVVYPAGYAVTRVRITTGNGLLSAANNDLTDGGTADLVVMDDFLYGEPHADLDLDGVIDAGDQCIPSDTRTKVDVNGDVAGQTSIDNITVSFGPGCTIQDYVNDIASDRTTRRSYVAAITQFANRLRRAKMISRDESVELKRAARTRSFD